MPDSEPVRPRASEANGEAAVTSSTASSAGAVSKAMVKYGELVILGYNGQLPQGTKNDEKIHASLHFSFVFGIRGNTNKNGVEMSKVHLYLNSDLQKISYFLLYLTVF